MLKRLGVGLLKGLLIGGAIGAGLTYGLHWSVAVGGILGFLLAMGAAGTTGVFAGRPPWQEGAWIESLLKGLFGVGVGALVYWLGSTYAAGPAIPLPGLADAAPWPGLPVVFLPVIAGVYGSLVELDNTGDDGKANKKKKGPPPPPPPRARVEIDTDSGLDVTEHAESTRPARGRKA